MKKKTIIVTVTSLLISKMGSSESRSELSSMAELTRVQAECQRYMKSLCNTRLLCWETGRFMSSARNRRSDARRFLRRSSTFFFGLFCLVFSSVFLSYFFKNKKMSQKLLYTCFLSDDGYQIIIYNRDLNRTEP